MPQPKKATFAVGIFEALEALRRALAELVSFGYDQKNFILLHPRDMPSDEIGLESLSIPLETLVTPIRSRPAQKIQYVEFDPPKTLSDLPTCDVTLVLNVQSWLSPSHFESLLEALRSEKSVLFIRIHEQHQVAPICSILLSHCTQRVNTHEVFLDSRFWKAR